MKLVTSHMVGIGDDGRAHWWRFAGGEELTRACDGIVAVNVEMWTRDKHAGAETCGACDRERRGA